MPVAPVAPEAVSVGEVSTGATISPVGDADLTSEAVEAPIAFTALSSTL